MFVIGNSYAQVQNESEYHLTNWFIDLNFKTGSLNQTLTTENLLGGYSQVVVNDSKAGKLSVSNGAARGGDFQLGYFFDSNHHFGVGVGLMYQQLSCNVKLDTLHAEYRSVDNISASVFRQLVTTGPVTEQVSSTNISIPIVLKYNTQISNTIGFTMDAGILYNIHYNNSYSTNASFTYEAIYDLQQVAPGQYVAVYDNRNTPQSTDQFLTISQYQKDHNNDGLYANYLTAHAKEGYNVGYKKSPDFTSGTNSFTSGSIGFLVHPALTVKLRHNVFLNLGVYYMSQSISNGANPNYKITDQVGSYTSVLQGVTKADNTSFGGNIGLRYVFVRGRWRDRDGDGIPDAQDRCPDVYGIKKFQGCPDVDGDGVPDAEDKCPTVWGLAKLHGCPDADGDGIPDKDDECPSVQGPAKFHGCPDNDGDGIPDKEDDCPYQAGPAKFFGCPDTDGDGISDNMDWCPYEAGPIENHGCPVDTGKNASRRYLRKADVEAEGNLDGMKDNSRSGAKKSETGTGSEGEKGKERATNKKQSSGDDEESDDSSPRVSRKHKHSHAKSDESTANNGDENTDWDSDKKMTRAEKRRAKKKARNGDEEDLNVLEENSVTFPLYYNVNEWSIRDESRATLEVALTKIITEGKGKNILIEGYADNTGPESYNKSLSQKRADEIRKYLIENGIKSERIRSVGKGVENPIGDNGNEEGRQKNRRVVLKWDTK